MPLESAYYQKFMMDRPDDGRSAKPQPTLQQRQYPHPANRMGIPGQYVGQESKKTLENTESNLYDTTDPDELQRASSNQPHCGSSQNVPPMYTSQDTTNSIRQRGVGDMVSEESPSSLAGVDHEGREPITPQGVRGRLQDSMVRISRFVSPAILITRARKDQRAISKSTHDMSPPPDLSNPYSQTAGLHTQSQVTFPNPEDKFSDSDVIDALERWNARVRQVAARMAQSFTQHFKFGNVMNTPTKEQASAVQSVSDYIGPTLVKSLGTKVPEDIHMLVEVAFEACFASACCQIACSATEPGFNASINGINRRLLKPESLVEVISDVLLVAGCTATQSDIASTVTSQFEASLTDLARRLTKTLDVITSSNFEVFIARPCDKFESKSMEDTEGSGVQGASILCTTSVGLLKRTPVETLLKTRRKRKVLVLKAKVLLESFLDY